MHLCKDCMDFIPAVAKQYFVGHVLFSVFIKML